VTDTVNHPTHYNAHPSGVEAIDVVEYLTFNLGNALKYLWRKDHKGRASEDAHKALWYLERELDRVLWADSSPSLPLIITRRMERVAHADDGVLGQVLLRVARAQNPTQMVNAIEFAIFAVKETIKETA
jgi:hypothetical protein